MGFLSKLRDRFQDGSAAPPPGATWAPPDPSSAASPYTLVLPRTVNVVGLFARGPHLGVVHDLYSPGSHGWGSVHFAAQLVPEPKNEHDRNAIAIVAAGGVCGYLSRAEAVEFGPLVRQTIKRHEAATVAAELVGVDELSVMGLEPAKATPMDLLSIARCLDVIYDGGEIYETENDAASLDVRVEPTKTGWKIGTVYWEDNEAKWLAKQLRKHGYTASAREGDNWTVSISKYEPPAPKP
jgi:hypothetical protein